MLDFKHLLEQDMEGKPPDLGWLTAAIAVAALIVGWLGGVARAAWNLSKFESRLGTVEGGYKSIFEKDVIHRLDLLEDLSDRLGEMPKILQSLENSVGTLAASVAALNNIIFQERGGLNVLTLHEFDKERIHCQEMFRKDLTRIDGNVKTLVENPPGTQQLKQILSAIEDIKRSNP